MKKQTKQIEIPTGFKIETFNQKTGEYTLVQQTDVTDRIRRIADAVNDLGDEDPEVIIYNKLISEFSDDSHIVNYQLAVMLTKAINEGWIPDWNNIKQPKYVLWFEMGGSSGFRYDDFVIWDSGSNVGSRLCFKEARLGDHLAKTFPEVFKWFMTIE